MGRRNSSKRRGRHRNLSLEFPEIFLSDEADGEDGAASRLAEATKGLGVRSPYVVASVHGKRLAEMVTGGRKLETPIRGADQGWASNLGVRALAQEADAIVAIGGGRCLDVAKLAAARSGLTVIAVPTQLSHDGICSPVAVVPNAEGRTESIGAVAPIAVFVSLPTLMGAPAASVVAGVGDLLANPLALRDWALAADKELEEIDQRAWDLSVRSFELIEPYLDGNLGKANDDPKFLNTLAEALILSGMSMICAGTSRPASGAEHEISHALDERFGARAMHGAQVAFGAIFSVALYGEDTDAFRRRLGTIGLPEHPRDLQLSEQDLVDLLLYAPATRPGRFTILEDSNLDERSARQLIKRIWEGSF